jgi:hypothetical protein
MLDFQLFCSLQVFKLGQGKTTRIKSQAIDEFIRREFIELLNCSEKPHDPIVVPSAKLYADFTEKVRKVQFSIKEQCLH